MSKFEDMNELFKQSNSGNGANIEDGRYQVNLMSIDIRTTKTGDPLIIWTLKELNSGHALKKFSVLSQQVSVEWFAKDLNIFTDRFDDLYDFEARKDCLIGSIISITKKTNGDYDSIYFDELISTPSDIPF